MISPIDVIPVRSPVVEVIDPLPLQDLPEPVANPEVPTQEGTQTRRDVLLAALLHAAAGSAVVGAGAVSRTLASESSSAPAAPPRQSFGGRLAWGAVRNVESRPTTRRTFAASVGGVALREAARSAAGGYVEFRRKMLRRDHPEGTANRNLKNKRR